MKHFGIIALCLLLTGCANVTTMKINKNVDGSLSINSGKDVSIGSLDYRNLKSGESLKVEKYTSNANTDVINAQTAREKAYIDGIISAIAAGAGLAKKGAGVP